VLERHTKSIEFAIHRTFQGKSLDSLHSFFMPLSGVRLHS
jgi:hypothetical protein